MRSRNFAKTMLSMGLSPRRITVDLPWIYRIRAFGVTSYGHLTIYGHNASATRLRVVSGIVQKIRQREGRTHTVRIVECCVHREEEEKEEKCDRL